MRLSSAVAAATLASLLAVGGTTSQRRTSSNGTQQAFALKFSSQEDGVSPRRSLLPLAIAFWDDDLASATDWDKFTHKGGALMCGLEGTDRTAGRQLEDLRNPPSAASPWPGDLKQELNNWYWHEFTPTSKGCELDDYWKFPATMQALGLSGKCRSEGGHNVCYRIEHWDQNKQENGVQVPAMNQWYKVGDSSYRSTGAHFEFNMNTNDGAIYGLYLDGPRSAASHNWYGNSKDPDPTLLPHLRSLSDILWGYWVRDNANIKNIRYLFMLGISNDQTNQLIASCLKNTKEELKEWPGTSFGTDTDEGHALLGSPNGATFAYFLMQHKAQLGHKTITKVTVIRPETIDDNDFVDASLVFHVADATEPPADEAESVKTKRQNSHTVEVIENGNDSVMRMHEFKACEPGETAM